MTTLATKLLSCVHNNPGVTRAEAARLLGVGTGAAAEIVAKLGASMLVAETPSTPSGARGRPTAVLGAHPRGPVVLAVSVTHEYWELAAFELGGVQLGGLKRVHDGRDGMAVLEDVAAAVRRFRQRFGAGRVRGIGVAAPGTVSDGVLRQASGLGWRELDLRAVWRRAPIFVADNDATFAAAAESRRGAAAGYEVALHVRVQAGVGGAVVTGGRVLPGAHGLAGEFGHMPFGDSALVCPCGARSCWGPMVDGSAMARLLGHSPPRDVLAYAQRVLARAAAGHQDERRVAETVSIALGRGLAGLVNALDPGIVTLGGLGVDVIAIAPDALHGAYGEGLMRFRGADPPPVVAAALGEAGVLAGAAEQVWAEVLPTI
jgi:predicted NBD/HSP70 family sugar kinase